MARKAKQPGPGEPRPNKRGSPKATAAKEAPPTKKRPSRKKTSKKRAASANRKPAKRKARSTRSKKRTEPARPEPKHDPADTEVTHPAAGSSESAPVVTVDPPPREAGSLPSPDDSMIDPDETWIAGRVRRATDQADPRPGPRKTPASLVVISHPDSMMLGGYFAIEPDSTVTIGRAKDAEIAFPEVMEISRKHARIRRFGGTTMVEDLGSRNGTVLNGSRVGEPRSLANGDLIEILNVKLKFFEGDDLEQAYHEELYHLAVHDELTRVYNRRRYEAEAERDFARARRHSSQLSLIVFDIDDFKRINDEWGHPAGDAVLEHIARLVEQHMRKEEIFARSGGDEFLVLCPDVPLSGATILAERLRALIAETRFEIEGRELNITCSFGVATVTPQMTSAKDLYATADRLLYRSKQRGRNNVSSA